MPLTIGGGNVDVGLKYLDEEARQRAAALDAARFQQSSMVQNQQLAQQDRQLQNQRSDSYNRALAQTQQAGTNLLTHQADLDARERAQALQLSQQRDFHEDDVDFNNAKLGQQDILNQRDNDRALESAQLRAQALADAREQANQAHQERLALAQERADAQKEQQAEAQIQRELTSNPEYKLAIASALANKDFPEEAQKHIERAIQIEQQIRTKRSMGGEASARAAALESGMLTPEDAGMTPPPSMPMSTPTTPAPMENFAPSAQLGNDMMGAVDRGEMTQEDAYANSTPEQSELRIGPRVDRPVRDWLEKPPQSKREQEQMLLEERRTERQRTNDEQKEKFEFSKSEKQRIADEHKAKMKKEVISEASSKSFAALAKNALEAGLSQEEIIDIHPFTRTLKDIETEFETADDKKAYLEYITAELNGTPPVNRTNKYYVVALPDKKDLPDNESVTPVMQWKRDVAAKWAELKKTPGARSDVLRKLKELDQPTNQPAKAAQSAAPKQSALPGTMKEYTKEQLATLPKGTRGMFKGRPFTKE